MAVAVGTHILLLTGIFQVSLAHPIALLLTMPITGQHFIHSICIVLFISKLTGSVGSNSLKPDLSFCPFALVHLIMLASVVSNWTEHSNYGNIWQRNAEFPTKRHTVHTNHVDDLPENFVDDRPQPAALPDDVQARLFLMKDNRITRHSRVDTASVTVTGGRQRQVSEWLCPGRHLQHNAAKV